MFESIWESVQSWFLTTCVRVLIILAGTWLVWWILRLGTSRLKTRLAADAKDPEAEKRVTTLVTILHGAAVVILIVTAAMVVVSHLGLNLGPLLATAGIGGLAIGFGAQNLVRDVISGFFILLEDQVRVGDVVQLNGQGGLVEAVTLRHIRLRDLGGTVHYFPNGNIDRVSNMTKQFSYYVIDLGIAYGEDTDEVASHMTRVVEEMRAESPWSADILEPLEVLGVDRFEDSAVILRARIKTKALKQWACGREFNRRIKKALDLAGIELPFPHRTLYWGGQTAGETPAMASAPAESEP